MEYILFKYREEIRSTIVSRLDKCVPDVRKIIPLEYIGFLFDNYTPNPKAEYKKKIPQVELSYYFFKDQLNYGRTKLGRKFNRLIGKTWGLFHQSGKLKTPKDYENPQTVAVAAGKCAELLAESRTNFGMLYVPDWEKVYQEDDNYDTKVRALETEFFEHSVDMLLLAYHKTVMFIHFSEKMGDNIKCLLSPLYDLFMKLTQDFKEINLSVILNDIKTEKNKNYARNSKRGDYLGYVHEVEKIKELSDRIQSIPNVNNSIEWNEFGGVSGIVSHGEEHSNNLLNLLGNIVLKHKGVRRYFDKNGGSVFCLSYACLFHDLGLTNTVLLLSEAGVDSIYVNKANHGKIFLDLSAKALIFSKPEAVEYFRNLSFDLANEVDRELLRIISLICGYHQHKSRILGTKSNPQNKIPRNPYKETIPMETKININNNRIRIDIQLLTAILRFLDASDVCCNRLTDINFTTRRSVIEKKIKEINQSCKNEYDMEPNEDCFPKIKEALSIMKTLHKEFFNGPINADSLSVKYDKIISLIKGAKIKNKAKCRNIKKEITNLAEQCHHYKKHLTFINAKFDDNGCIVYAPALSASLDELINFYSSTDGVTSVRKDLKKELDDCDKIFRKRNINLGKSRLFDPLKDNIREFYK